MRQDGIRISVVHEGIRLNSDKHQRLANLYGQEIKIPVLRGHGIVRREAVQPGRS